MENKEKIKTENSYIEYSFDWDTNIPVGKTETEHYNDLVKKLTDLIKEKCNTKNRLRIFINDSLNQIFYNNKNFIKNELIDETKGTYEIGELKIDSETSIKVLATCSFIQKGKIVIQDDDSYNTVLGYIRDHIYESKMKEKISLNLSRKSLEIILEALKEYSSKYTTLAYESIKVDEGIYSANDETFPYYFKTLNKSIYASELIDIIKEKEKEN